MGKRTITDRRAVRLFAVSFLLNGCYAMLLKGKLGKIEAFPDIPPFNLKPSVYLDLSMREAARTAGKAAEVDRSLLTDEALRRSFKEAVARVTEQSELFWSFTFDPTQAQNMDYTIHIELSETKESLSVLRLWDNMVKVLYKKISDDRLLSYFSSNISNVEVSPVQTLSVG